MTTATKAPPSLDILRGSVRVLEAAQAEGLPIPSVCMSVDTYTYGGLSWIADDLAEVEAWAAWLDLDVEHRPADRATHHRAEGERFDVRVTVTWIEKQVRS